MIALETAEQSSLRPLMRVEYDRLIELGCFEDERLELLNGLLVRMSPQEAPHASTIRKLTERLLPRCLGRAHVRVQLPLVAGDDSEPEPDLALAEPGDDAVEHPSRALLVIEVSDTTLRKDRQVKGPLYATAGFPEYWIVNLVEQVVEIHRDPSGGRYGTVRTAHRGESIAPLCFPDIELEVDGLLP